MARTTKEIQDSIIQNIEQNGITLSSSKVSEGRLWIFVVASAIHSVEVIFDIFKSEVDKIADKVTSGTVRWYADQCRVWQNGHELLYNKKSADIYYAVDDPESRLIKTVAIIEESKKLSIKVAKLSEQNEIEPLTADELYNFTGYIESIRVGGTEMVCISTFADDIKYIAEIYYTPAVPVTTVSDNVKIAINNFRQTLDFDSKFYTQKFIDVIMGVHGVVTVDLKEIHHKSISNAILTPVVIVTDLEAGYFNYTDDSVLTFKSTLKW